MSKKDKVLLVDDHIGDIRWAVDELEDAGYQVMHETNGNAARTHLQRIAEDVANERSTYCLAIIDIMVSTMDIMDLVELDDEFYGESKDTGIHLCSFAREGLQLSKEELPIACITARSDHDKVQQELDQWHIPLFDRVPEGSGASLRDYLKKACPSIKDE